MPVTFDNIMWRGQLDGANETGLKMDVVFRNITLADSCQRGIALLGPDIWGPLKKKKKLTLTLNKTWSY